MGIFTQVYILPDFEAVYLSGVFLGLFKSCIQPLQLVSRVWHALRFLIDVVVEVGIQYHHQQIAPCHAIERSCEVHKKIKLHKSDVGVPFLFLCKSPDSKVYTENIIVRYA